MSCAHGVAVLSIATHGTTTDVPTGAARAVSACGQPAPPTTGSHGPSQPACGVATCSSDDDGASSTVACGASVSLSLRTMRSPRGAKPAWPFFGGNASRRTQCATPGPCRCRPVGGAARLRPVKRAARPRDRTMHAGCAIGATRGSWHADEHSRPQRPERRRWPPAHRPSHPAGPHRGQGVPVDGGCAGGGQGAAGSGGGGN